MVVEYVQGESGLELVEKPAPAKTAVVPSSDSEAGKEWLLELRLVVEVLVSRVSCVSRELVWWLKFWSHDFISSQRSQWEQCPIASKPLEEKLHLPC